VAGKRRGIFVAGLAAGAFATWLFATKQGKQVRDRLKGGAQALDEAPASQGDGAVDADARSEALRLKIEETRRRLREQVGLPPEEEG
jgi:gas vesicle protein